MATSMGFPRFGEALSAIFLVLLLAGFATFTLASQRNEPSISCEGRRPPFRTAAVHTRSDYALACTDSHGVWHGPYQERFDDATLALSGYYKRGQPEGLWTFFYRKGTQMTRGSFHAGRREGQWTSFYENGRLLGQGPYRKDTLDGYWTAWHESGSRKSAGAYRKGEEVGRWTYWYPSGRRDRSGEYQGRRIMLPQNVSVPAERGKWTYWYESGNKRLEGCFRNGEQIGVWTEWSEDGHVKSHVTRGGSADTACR
jgi:antitoxin component YwqK of YwqJK toxin-antitoxin module